MSPPCLIFDHDEDNLVKMALHSHWRDCDAWRSYGVPLSTTSNTACKMYDAALTQFVGWYNDESVGGVENTFKQMLDADPNFVMGHAMMNGMQLLSANKTPRLDPEFKARIDHMVALADKNGITEAERKHVKAVQLAAEGHLEKAFLTWDDIVMENPRDLLAIKAGFSACFYLSAHQQMRGIVARAMSSWTPDMPNYNYLHGMLAFGLEEMNLHKEAESACRKGLELNQNDGWATHILSHVLEDVGRIEEVNQMMGSTENNWAKCSMISTHNYWHWALYHIEKGDYEAALGIHDNYIVPSIKSEDSLFHLTDAASLLMRLELEGKNVGDRWNDTYERSKTHTDDHINAFYDAHLLWSLVGSKQMDTAQRMMQSLEEFINKDKGYNSSIVKETGMSVYKSIMAYGEGDYAGTVRLLYPVRYDIIRMGGSHAQRDIFQLFLINAALKSPERQHRQLARQLVLERKSTREDTPLTERLFAKTLAHHAD